MSSKSERAEAARHFARSLVAFCEETDDGLRRLASQVEEMHGSDQLDDEDYAAYSPEFSDSMSNLRRVLAEFSEDQASRLQALASKIEEAGY